MIGKGEAPTVRLHHTRQSTAKQSQDPLWVTAKHKKTCPLNYQTIEGSLNTHVQMLATTVTHSNTKLTGDHK